MSSIKYYILNDNKGPIFDIPNDIQNCCAKIDYHAASINDARDLIDSTLNKISSLSPDLDLIKSQIESLGENWNNYAKIDDNAIESIFLEDLNKDINSIVDSFENGKSQCDIMLDSFNETINEINSCIDTLNSNYDTYDKLGKEAATYFRKMRNLDLTEEERLEYINLYNETMKKISNYRQINNFSDLGKWVETI